jgi:flagellar hook protein FlgE
MDVIAHNIANVNTHGFKASRMTFADAFSQTLRGASGPNPDVGRGGTNPMQVGLGVNVSSIQRQMAPGAAQRTDDPFHLMIEGDGFFVVGDDVNGLFFTRAGDFQRDAHWNIHAANGMLLQGWPARWDNGNPFHATGEIRQPVRGPVEGIQIDPFMRNVPPRATGNVDFIGNIRYSDAISPDNPHGLLSTVTFQDSLGTTYQLSIRFNWVTNRGDGATPAEGWQVQVYNRMIRTEDNTTLPPTTDAAGAAIAGLQWSGAAVPGSPGWHVMTNINFNENGRPDIPATSNPFIVDMQITDAATLAHFPPGVYFGQIPAGGAEADRAIRVDFSAMTQHAGNTNVTQHTQDGLAPGNLIGLSVGADGIITGSYSNGQSFPLWQVVLAQFDNPAGLAAMGANMFAVTVNSGDFDGVGLTPGGAGTQLLGGTLEMSNVDLAAEFTEMITTQRGFQANSRIISTSDELLQELVNLRR